MAYIGKQPVVGNFQVCDAISVVNGQAAYTMQVSSANVEPENANHMLVSLNGVLQKPGSSFTISGATITFASNLATGDVIDFIILLGDVLNTGTPSDTAVKAASLNNDIISGQTALTSAPDDTDELLISDAGTIKRIDVSLVGGKNTPAFYAYQQAGTAVELSTGTFTKLVFGTEVFDTDSKYDASAGRFTPATAGKYFVFGAVAFSTGTDFSQNECAIYKNGSQEVINISDNDSYSASYVTGIIDMDADDYVEIYAKHNLGSSVYTLPDNAGKYVRFGAYKLIT